MEEDCTFVAPGHLPSRWQWPKGYPQNQQGCHPSQPYQRNAQTYQYNSQAYQNTTWAHQNNAQGYPNSAQPYYYNTQPYQNKTQAYQPPETYSCGPCNRTFHSQYLLERHLQEHVKCPFPECHLSAHPKAIERHIDNQHLLVNFANLQIDDEAWIAERKRRFPTSERAELRRAQQLEKTKRGERLGKSAKPFAPRGARGRGRGRGRGKVGGGSGGGGDDGGSGKNEKKRPGDSECSDQRGRKRRMMQEGRKDKVEEDNKGGERNLVPPPSHPFKEAPRRQRSARAAIITVPDPDSEDEGTRDGIPAFCGTRHFYESTGEVSYFGTKSGTAPECHIKGDEKVKETEQAEVNHISDEEDWDENGSRMASVGAPTVPPTTLVLGGALGNLMGAYSDSEDNSDTPESAVEAVRQSSIQDQTQNMLKNHLSSGNQAVEQRTGDKSIGRKATAAGPTMATTTLPAAATDMLVPSKTHRHRKKKRHLKKGARRVPKHPVGAPSCFPKRRKTLLERLLLPDITRERNIILQCIRFIVQNNFLSVQGREGEKEEEEGWGQKSEEKDGQKEGSQKSKVEEDEESQGKERLGESHKTNMDVEELNQREKEEDGKGKESKVKGKRQEKEEKSKRNEGEAGIGEVIHQEGRETRQDRREGGPRKSEGGAE